MVSPSRHKCLLPSLGNSLLSAFDSLAAILFPTLCCHCGEPLVGDEHDLCTHCLFSLTWTHHAAQPDNSTEQRLLGRIPYQAAASLFYFHKDGVVQSVVHQIKYYGNTRLALQCGRMMGEELLRSHRFDDIDLIVPVPLHRLRQRHRGYNQSLLLCQGIAQVLHKPISSDNLYRKHYSATQTHKDRIQRMDNMAGIFAVRHPEAFAHRHLLLVDDTLTTGATTESCHQALQPIPGLRISVATLAIVTH